MWLKCEVVMFRLWMVVMIVCLLVCSVFNNCNWCWMLRWLVGLFNKMRLVFWVSLCVMMVCCCLLFDKWLYWWLIKWFNLIKVKVLWMIVCLECCFICYGLWCGVCFSVIIFFSRRFGEGDFFCLMNVMSWVCCMGVYWFMDFLLSRIFLVLIFLMLVMDCNSVDLFILLILMMVVSCFVFVVKFMLLMMMWLLIWYCILWMLRYVMIYLRIGIGCDLWGIGRWVY